MAMVRASETGTPLECKEKKGDLPLPSLSLLSAKGLGGTHFSPSSQLRGGFSSAPLVVSLAKSSLEPPHRFVLIFVSF